MKTNIDILKEVTSEVLRFQKKLTLALREQMIKGDTHSGNREYSACKRAALDLKKELNKLTQDTTYKYQK